MSSEYPIRPKITAWARYLCMAFGIACAVGGIDSIRSSPLDPFPLMAGLLIGGVWFGFGFYGGLPLVNTVRDWCPAITPNEVNNQHRRGLLVMRRRRWAMWASMPSTFVIAAIVMFPMMRSGQPGLTVLLFGIPLVINFRYFLSRCPRCGYGFFSRSKSRAATLNIRKACGHCDLSLYAYKDHKP